MIEGIAGHYCGQKQPHAAHEWRTPPVYGALTVNGAYQCAGLSPTVVNVFNKKGKKK